MRGPVAVCLRCRGPWGECAGEADAVGIWRKGGRVLARKRFLLARQQPWRLAVVKEILRQAQDDKYKAGALLSYRFFDYLCFRQVGRRIGR